VLARAAQLQKEVQAAYDDYEFHRVYQQVHNFCVVDLGSFYLDVIKDRLYTTGRVSLSGAPPRRHVSHRGSHGALAGAHPELHRRRDLGVPARAPRRVGVSRDLACTPGCDGSGHRLGEAPVGPGDRRQALEALRDSGSIGSGLDARIAIFADGPLGKSSAASATNLRFVFITSGRQCAGGRAAADARR